MSACHPSRRQLLRWAGLVAAAPALGSALELALDRPRAWGAALAVPQQLELVTLTESSCVLTWFTGDPTSPDAAGRPSPVPSDTEVLLGTSPASLRPVVQRDDRTAYHQAEVTGLEPGQTYFYAARSGGVPATPAPFALGNPVGTGTLTGAALGTGVFSFTTPQPPAGRHLFTLALANDLHVGETVAGLAYSNGALPGGGLPPGFTQVPGEPPYAEVCARSLVADARARGADVLLVAGDVTSEAAPVDLRDAVGILGGFGQLGRDVLVARGNHDRPHDGDAYAGCRAAPGGTHDCFADAVHPTGTTWFRHDLGGLRLLGLDTYDKTGNGGDNGMLSAAQEDWFTRELRDDPDRPTLVFGHHPVTLESTLVNANPVRFDLDPQQALRVEQAYAAAPGVFLHHAGHTHRNKRSTGAVARSVTFQEVSATKEYPTCFALLRVHEGGFALNAYPLSSPLAREWRERTRQEDLGLAPFYTAGTLGDRNLVVQRDLSGVTRLPGTPGGAASPAPSRSPAPRRSTAPAPAPTRSPGAAGAQPVPAVGGATLAQTGGGLVVGAAGAAALAAAAAAARATRADRAPGPDA